VKPDRPKGLSLEKGLLGPLFFEGLHILAEDPLLTLVLRMAGKRGQTLYLVGGMVRDICLKSPLSHDYDFVCHGRAAGLAGEVALGLGGSAFILDKENGLYRVVKKAREGKGAVTMDFLPLNYPSIEDDLRARDFTVNAMAIPLTFTARGDRGVKGEKGGRALPSFIDPMGGLEDCEKRVLRLVSGDKTLKADPLRSLRAVRLSERYGLSIDRATENSIREFAGLLQENSISRERIRDELTLIFEAPGTSTAITRLIELSLSNMLLPSCNLTASGESNERPLAFKSLDEAERIIGEIKAGAFPHRPFDMKKAFAGKARGLSTALILKLAAFFYDIAIAKREDAIHAASILKGLRFGNKTVRAVKGLLLNLERWLQMPLAAYDSPAAMALLFRLAEEESGVSPPIFIAFAMIAARGAAGPSKAGRLHALESMADYYFDTFIIAPLGPLLDGVDIMRDFNITEGEAVGEVKNELERAILGGEIRNKKDARTYIKKWIGERWG